MAYLKIAATSMGTVVLLALLLKPCIPPSSLPVVSQLLPAVSWLEPPYIYVFINFIVLAIAASSKLHLNPSEEPPQMITVLSPEDELHVAGGEFDFDRELKEEIITEDSSKVMTMEVVDSEVDKFIISSPEIIVSPNDDNEEAGDPALMSPLEQHGTLEDTWKAITEGQQQEQKEKDTWMDYNRQMQLQDSEVHAQEMVKSETFKDRRRTNCTARKEPSLSQDELNRRVEEFIKKFNEEMRLQREESLNRYKEMISRGA